MVHKNKTILLATKKGKLRFAISFSKFSSDFVHSRYFYGRESRGLLCNYVPKM